MGKARLGSLLLANGIVLVICLIVAESGVRLAGALLPGKLSSGEFDFTNYATSNLLNGTIYPAMPDRELGWIPRPGSHRMWNSAFNIRQDTTRSTGDGVDASRPPCVLALGDSYTWGDEVADYETWPAQLQRTIGCHVVNGGVFAYGIDQAIMRGERLKTETRAPTAILAFIPDDIYRTEFRVRGVRLS